MSIDLEKIQGKIALLERANDFTSDRAAARALGLSHSLFSKIRRQCRAQSYEETLQKLGKPSGRPKKRPFNRDPDILIPWIASENPEWTTREIAASLRELGFSRIWSADVARVLKQKGVGKPEARPASKKPDFNDALLGFLNRHPLRFLYLTATELMRQAKGELELVRAAKKLDLADQKALDEIASSARGDIKTIRALKKALVREEGKVKCYDDLLQPDERAKS